MSTVTCRHHRIYQDADNTFRCGDCHEVVQREEWEYTHSRAWDD